MFRGHVAKCRPLFWGQDKAWFCFSSPYFMSLVYASSSASSSSAVLVSRCCRRGPPPPPPRRWFDWLLFPKMSKVLRVKSLSWIQDVAKVENFAAQWWLRYEFQKRLISLMGHSNTNWLVLIKHRKKHKNNALIYRTWKFCKSTENVTSMCFLGWSVAERSNVRTNHEKNNESWKFQTRQSLQLNRRVTSYQPRLLPSPRPPPWRRPGDRGDRGERGARPDERSLEPPRRGARGTGISDVASCMLMGRPSRGTPLYCFIALMASARRSKTTSAVPGRGE